MPVPRTVAATTGLIPGLLAATERAAAAEERVIEIERAAQRSA